MKKDSRKPGVVMISSTDVCPAGLITVNSQSRDVIPGVYKGVVCSISSKVHDFLAEDAAAGNCGSDVVFCSWTSTLDTKKLLPSLDTPLSLLPTSDSYSLLLEAPNRTG